MVEYYARVIDNDANGKTHLVGNLPCLEALEVLQQQLGKPHRHVESNILKRTTLLRNALCDALKSGGDWDRRLIERLLEAAHGLEYVGRAVRNHKRREENAHIDVFGSNGRTRRAVTEGAEHVNALEAAAGGGDDGLLAQEDDEFLKTERGEQLSAEWDEN